jgi:hypothetical protein
MDRAEEVAVGYVDEWMDRMELLLTSGDKKFLIRSLASALRAARDEALEEAIKICGCLSSEKRQCSPKYDGHDIRWCAVCEDMKDAYAVAEEKIRALKSDAGKP